MDQVIAPIGKIISIHGPIVEVKFDPEALLPAIHDIIQTQTYDGQKVVLEVAEHAENHVARCIALGSTYDIPRNAKAVATGSPIMAPVGDAMFGRVSNFDPPILRHTLLSNIQFGHDFNTRNNRRIKVFNVRRHPRVIENPVNSVP